MNRKIAQTLLLLTLVTAGISACGRSEPEPTPIPLRPTFTPTPATPIVIHVAPGQPGAPGQMPAGPQSMPLAGGIQPGQAMMALPPAAAESASENLADVGEVKDSAVSTVVGVMESTENAAAIATPVAGAQPATIVQSQPTGQAEAQAMQSGPGGQGPDLAAIAAELGVSEDAVQAAMGEPGQGQPDFAAIAAELSVSEEALMAVLGGPPNGQPPAGGPPSNQP